MSVAALVISVATVTQEASADTSDARVAYGRGKAAYDAGDFGEAAKQFAVADALVPNRDVLELAIVSAAKADDPILGMAFVERAEKRNLFEVARNGRSIFGEKIGKVDIACPGSKQCVATVDGEPFTVGAPTWLRAGDHTVVLDADGNVEEIPIRTTASETTMVRPTRVLRVPVVTTAANVIETTPPPPAPESTASSNKLAPAWFFVAVGATAIAGGATVLSGVDAEHTHDAFQRDRSNQDLANAGQSAQARTNALLVTTGILAVGTTVMGLFFVRWTKPTRSNVAYAF